MPDESRKLPIDKSKLPSRHVTVGPERAPHRSFFYAMGVTEELDVGLYFKRLLAYETLFGSTASHLRRHAALSLPASRVA